MTDPLSFTSASPRFALPLLHVGQAQKEVTVNEAVVRMSALLHPTVEAEQDTPPVSPVEGQAWLVAEGGTGQWSGYDGHLAHFAGGTWIFIAPEDGMQMFDKAAGQHIRYDGSWTRAAAPAEPSGGATIDAEARTAISGILAALRHCAILPAD